MAALHATAVAIAGHALMIRGASRAGKSRLALALIARSTRSRPIVLVGDDRVILQEIDGYLVAAPHPRIAGFIERRGIGIIAMPWISHAPVAGSVCIGTAPSEPVLGGLPRFEIATLDDVDASATSIIAWWGMDGAAARATHSPGKARADVRSRAKD